MTGLTPGAQVSLLDARGQDGRDAARPTRSAALLFRNVKPGSGYRVRRRRRRAQSGPLTVLSTQSAPPSTDVYDQEIPPSGYGYLTTRDGTKLAIYVHPPQDVANALPGASTCRRCPAGPDADPDRVLGLRLRRPGRARRAGSSILANLMGFTVVDVNMRGTGCSGGAFDFFEPLQSLDGYDVIETIARQPWVQHDKVGMMGISYGGISQLFTAADAAAEPGRDHAAVGDRRDADDALPGRHPQHRLRLRVGQGAGPRRQAGRRRTRASRGPTSGSRRATRPARTTRRCTPRRPTCCEKIRANDHYVPEGRRPARRRSRSSTRSTCPTFMACQWTGRADRRPLPDARHAASPAPTRSGSRSPTAPTSTRSPRRRSTAGTTSSSSTSPSRRRSRTRRAIQAARAGHLPGGDGDRRA